MIHLLKNKTKTPVKAKKMVNLKIRVEIKGWIGRESEDINENQTKGTQWVKVLPHKLSDLTSIPALM